MTIETLNQASTEQFLALIGGPLEGETWLAERVAPQRPFANVEALYSAFKQVMDNASEAEKISLITSHPDLAGKASVEGTLSDTSKREQAAAGLDRLTPEEFSAFHQYNSAYKDRFGFPFVICARENTKESILSAFQSRLENERTAEIETGVGEVLKILRLRLIDKFEE
jgi:2-oxo-4-hydroxy-4-carboxy-5-ureidoimidazoline decarboxylase